MSKFYFASHSLLLLALISSSAFAEPLSFHRAFNSSQYDVASPATLEFAVLKVEQSIIPIAIADIPNVVETDSPIDWFITESNASDYGFDWAAANAQIVGVDRVTRIGFNGSGIYAPLLDDDETRRLIAFDLDEIHIKLRHWNRSDPPFVSGQLQMEWWVSGTGLLVPEPCCGLLSIPPLALLLRARRQRPSRIPV